MTFDRTFSTALGEAFRADHRVSGPAELLEAIPYLLGFRPSDSMVLVGLAGHRLVVVARIDLVDAAEAVPRTLAAMVHGGTSEVVIALYDNTADPARAYEPLPWADVALVAADSVTQAGCELVEVLLVARGRWWSYLCDVPECCPPQGQPLPPAPSAFAAAAPLAGVVVMPDREAVATLLDPVPGREALLPLLAAARVRAEQPHVTGGSRTREISAKRALFAAARVSAEPDWPGVDEPGLARFAVELCSVNVRDAVWLAVDSQRLDGRPLWRELACRLPAPYDATPLFLFAWRTWRAGDGTLARMAAERALDSDPALSAAELLIAALSAGINPRRLPRLRAGRQAVPR